MQDYQLVDSTLYITDCTKCIELEFSCPNHKAVSKRIAKVTALIDELTEFKAALQQAQAYYEPKTFHY